MEPQRSPANPARAPAKLERLGPGRSRTGRRHVEQALARHLWRRIPAEINPDAHGSVLDMLEGAMQRFADKPAFRCFGQTLTYADTDRLSRHFAAYLQGRLGVKKGDRIAVMLPNIPAFPLAMLGIVRAGAVQVNVNPLYTPRELEHQLNDAGVEIIVIFSGVSATLAEIIGKTAVKQVISVGLGDGTGAALPSPPVDARLTNVVAFSDALAEGADLAFTPVRAERRRPALPAIHRRHHRAFEGRRAVAPQPRRQHRAVQGVHVRMPCVPGEEVVVTALPLYHIFALMVNFITYFSIGAENWLVPNPRDMDSFIETPAQGALHRLHRREHAVRRAGDAPEDQRSGLLQAARGDRRRRHSAAHDLGKMEGADRKAHPRRLRPVGNLPDPHPQSDDGDRLLGDRGPAVPVDRHQAARRRRQGSAARRSRAKSAPRVRR